MNANIEAMTTTMAKTQMESTTSPAHPSRESSTQDGAILHANITKSVERKQIVTAADVWLCERRNGTWCWPRSVVGDPECLR